MEAKSKEDPYRQIEALSETVKRQEKIIAAKDEIIAADKDGIAAHKKLKDIADELIEEYKQELARLKLLNEKISESKDREIRALREQLEARNKVVTIPPDDTWDSGEE